MNQLYAIAIQMNQLYAIYVFNAFSIKLYVIIQNIKQDGDYFGDQKQWNQYVNQCGIEDLKYPEYELSKQVENLREKEKHMADELRQMRRNIYNELLALASILKFESK